MCRILFFYSSLQAVLVSPAELITIILILHIRQTRKKLCHYILPLHTSKSSTPSPKYWLTIRCRDRVTSHRWVAHCE